MDKGKSFEILPDKIDNTEKNESPDVNYWRGFRELYNDPEFEKAKSEEFLENEQDGEQDSKASGLSRRKFLALLSASAAFAAAGCQNFRDKGEIVPYKNKPEEITLGNPNYYASTCTSCNNTCGILIKTREGRPIKIDGNPDHPVSKGKICATGQASILNLYDPERLKEPQFNLGNGNFNSVSWQNVDEKVAEELKKISESGKEIAILTHTITSPTQRKLFEEFQSKYPTTKIYSYELVNDLQKKNAWKKSYRSDNVPAVKLNDAKVVLALESDFLGTDGNKIEQVRLYSQGREVVGKEKFNRLYAIEGAVSLTGLNADYRIRFRPDAIGEFVMCLLNEFIIKRRISNYADDSTIQNKLRPYSLADFIKTHNLTEEAVRHLLEDLSNNQGQSIVLAGLQMPESTHIAVNFLNEVLGNTKLYSTEYHTEVLPLSSKSEIDELISRMQSGNVGMVIHYDTNPRYHFSKDYKYSETLKQVGLVISMTESLNETSDVCNYVLPINHNFESWGDYQTRSGFYSLQQPVIAPLYNTRQKEAILLNWLSENNNSYNDNIYHLYLKSNWKTSVFPSLNLSTSFRNFWLGSLHDGVVILKDNPSEKVQFQVDSFVSNNINKPSSGFVVLLKESNFIGDGRYANNGWLQELPHPISKIVWDNYAAVSPNTAKSLGLGGNDNIEIATSGKSLTLPAFIQPGVADNVVSIALGYGRTKAGVIGSEVGFNAIDLISKNAKLTEWIYNDGKVLKASGSYELISTQEHYPVDDKKFKDIQFKRHIIQEGTYKQYKKNPEFIKKQDEEENKMGNFPSVNKEHEYTGVKWAMAIDLNKCIGCEDCVAACNVENNIPVVGKEQVKRSREMHWIRIDRYYSGTPQEPKASFQPILCQQCDFAPCENVCPVKATSHTTDGLNGMTYNRCVGTRYCSNNCPYKVRRFNFFHYRDDFKDSFYLSESFSLLNNPEVTVRSRGVMEKCTFCVQRIMNARQLATQEQKELKGSDVLTACQEACGADAIVFGDMNNKESVLQDYRNHNLSYYLLEELKIKPNITFIAKLRNTNEENVEGKH